MGRPITIEYAVKLNLFLWHMPADTTEGVAEHSTRLQPSINLMCIYSENKVIPNTGQSESVPPLTSHYQDIDPIRAIPAN